MRKKTKENKTSNGIKLDLHDEFYYSKRAASFAYFMKLFGKCNDWSEYYDLETRNILLNYCRDNYSIIKFPEELLKEYSVEKNEFENFYYNSFQAIFGDKQDNLFKECNQRLKVLIDGDLKIFPFATHSVYYDLKIDKFIIENFSITINSLLAIPELLYRNMYLLKLFNEKRYAATRISYFNYLFSDLGQLIAADYIAKETKKADFNNIIIKRINSILNADSNGSKRLEKGLENVLARNEGKNILDLKLMVDESEGLLLTALEEIDTVLVSQVYAYKLFEKYKQDNKKFQEFMNQIVDDDALIEDMLKYYGINKNSIKKIYL